MDQTELLLQEITDAHGVPGYEDGARAVMAKYLQKFSEVSYDKLGSVVGRKIGSAPSPRVLIGGHLDEVGFMVKE
ncbi:MAG: peptidase M28, partial [Candidatus Zixiibacteriota bacterium]